MKTYKPTTPSRRNMATIEYRKLLTRGAKPHKPLTKGAVNKAGRNNLGRITVRHQGGGNKKLYRDVDFGYSKQGVPGKLTTVEYDPYRTAFIGLVVFRDGDKRYMVVPKDVAVGATLEAGEKVPFTIGNKLPLAKIPVGTFVYNIEIKPHGGGKLARSAGNFAQVVAQDDGYTSLKMPSTEIRKVLDTCWATIGTVSNDEYHLTKWGKAGKSRWKGVRPTVRGSAQNPVDHPYGGGEGAQGRGTRRPKTKWGKITGGRKTRTPKKYSNPLIVSRRKVGKKR